MYLAIDPGGTNGWATFSAEGNVTGLGQVSLEDLPEFMEALSPVPHTIIYEDFRLLKKKALQQSGSNMPASQGIGVIKSYAKRHNCFTVEQPASIKPDAQRFTQVRPPSNHANSHQIDAYNHGMYYLIKKGVAKTALEEENARNRNL